MGIRSFSKAYFRPMRNQSRHHYWSFNSSRPWPEGCERDEHVCGLQFPQWCIQKNGGSDISLLPLRRLMHFLHESRIWRHTDYISLDQVDVRDVAQAHIIAMTSSSASQHRILLVSGLLSPQLVANIIREKVPELRSRVIEGDPKQILPKGIKPTGWDTSKSNEILGGNRWRYIGLEQSVHDTVRSLQDLEKTWGV